MTSQNPESLPAVAINPQAPEGLQTFLRQSAEASALSRVEPDATVALAYSGVVPAALKLAASAGGLGVLVWLSALGIDATAPTEDERSMPGAELMHTGMEWVHWFTILFLLLAVGTGAFMVYVAWINYEADRSHLRQLQEAQPHFILPGELTEAARVQLARAQGAAAAILRSKVNSADLIDRQRNRLSLPLQVWDIAEALAEHSRLAKQQPQQAATTERLLKVVGARGAALETARQGIERRVAALETYAAQVAEADARYAEWTQAQELAASSDQVLELLARTAADDLAVAELAGLTGEAAAVAEALQSAVEAARSAGAIALPSRDAAA